ncbi:electron transporter, putative [Actinidia rufa]|uniref:Electron transporter, putative n=1 Tax=Actinidia rufa TaxID=165716 RepID=A0A7J0EUC6_9ERIC|nr:electron transporter, putative [Actinidia rufa]
MEQAFLCFVSLGTPACIARIPDFIDVREVTNYSAAKKKQSLSTEVQNSLKQEILHLQKQLEEQSVVRSALEKALTNRPLSHDPTNKNSITKPVEDLIKEIAVLELEVVYLEKYISFVESGDLLGGNTLTDSSIHRSHSSLSQHSARSFRTYAPTGALAEAVESYHSLPLSMLECAHAATSNATSLAEHVGASVPDRITETPNWVSEEMINVSMFRGAQNRGKALLAVPWIQNPFNIEGSKEFSGSCSSMIEVQWISRDSWRLRHVKHMLQHYRSLVARLEEVDPKRMKHEEKLAFWINVHNALVMHAFLVYGIPNNSLKRISSLLKAAYNVGGRTISVDMMQNSILGCRLPRPGQWLQSLFFPKTKFKVRDARKAYAIEHPEPRLYFALCSGRHSDPVVRMYTPKGVFQELEAAKEDYIQTTLRVHKEQKIVLPKIVDSFAKDSDLCPGGLIEMIEHFFPNSLRRSFQQHQRGKISKRIAWIPHNFTFRYLLSKELAK